MTAGRANVQNVYPLGPMQSGLLFQWLAGPGDDRDIVQSRFVLDGPLDPLRFEESWRALVSRHDILRTRLAWRNLSQPVQIVQRQIGVDVNWCDSESLAADRARGVRLDTESPVRITVVRSGPVEHHLILTYHHAFLDAWSLSILMRELFSIYHGRAQQLPPAPQFVDYIGWVAQQDTTAAQRYWTGVLRGRTGADGLGFERPRSMPDGRPTGTVVRVLSGDATSALLTAAAALRVTPGALVQGAWAALLSALTGERDVVYGCTVAGRAPGPPGAGNIVGPCANTLPIRVAVDPGAPVADLLTSVQAALLDAQRHQYCSLSQIRAWADQPADRAVFDSLVVYHNPGLLSLVAGDGGEVAVRPAPAEERPGLPVTLVVSQRSELALGLRYERAELTDRDAERTLGMLRRLLTSMSAQPQARLDDMDLVGDREWNQVLVEWNRTDVRPAARPGTPYERFSAQARRTPDATAVRCDGHHLTYQQLATRTRHLTHHLTTLGIRPGDRVAVSLHRDHDTVTTILAILASGAAYIPLDPAYPAERLRRMLTSSRVDLLITTTRLAQYDVPTLHLDTWSPAGEHTDPPRPHPDNLAYVIYTSGSTGQPKGVMVTHRAALNTLDWMQEHFPLAPGDVVAQKTSLSFTDSIWELLWPLLAGAQIEVLPDDTVRDPAELCRALRRHRVSCTQFVPPLMSAFLAAEDGGDLPDLRWVFNGGEALPETLATRWARRFPQARIVNAYGMTESAIYATWEVVEADPAAGAGVLIGRPITNERVYVCDPDGTPVVPGVVGELCVGGLSLALGYLDRPDLTAERFVPDSCSGRPGERLYRTGDLGRHLADGRLRYVGRADHQVKVRGVRVELGEVESVLRRHPAVAQAAVVAVPDAAGGHRLVAHVVAAPGHPLRTGELREFAGKELPAAMVPVAVARHEAMPLNVNGKVDRRRLAELDVPTEGKQRHVEPRTDAERLLAAVWSRLLGVLQVGTHDDFFDLGGHSLLVMPVIAEVRGRTGVELGVRDVVDRPVLHVLAAEIDERARSAGPGRASVPAAAAAAPARRLVPIGTTGTRPPFFAVHHGRGDALSYVRLAQRLGPDRPCYGLQALGVDTDDEPVRRVEAMSESYVDALRQVRSSRRVHLGGWSFGGVVAFDMACRLSAAGEPPGVLALIDAPVLTEELEDVWRDMRRQVHEMTALVERSREERDWPPESLTRRADGLRGHFRPATLSGGAEAVLRVLRVIDANAEAFQTYRPPVYPGRLLLFVAGDEPGADRLGENWGRLAAEVTVHRLPGRHMDLVIEPGVANLATLLDEHLAESDVQ